MFTVHICSLKSINCHWDTIDSSPENGCICFTKKQKIKAAEHAKKYVRNRFKYIKNVTPEYIGRSSAIFGAVAAATMPVCSFILAMVVDVTGIYVILKTAIAAAVFATVILFAKTSHM